MTRPDLPSLVDRLRLFVREASIQPDPDVKPWNGGVYAVLDCMYSAQTRYNSVVLPMLEERFPGNSGLRDEPGLTFTTFVEHVGSSPTPERFEVYAKDILGNRQRLSGRLKVEVAWEIAGFFAKRNLETRADLLALGSDPLARLVLDELVPAVRGMGPILGRYLLLLLGLEEYVKPDTLLCRLMGRLGGWQPILGHEGDMHLIQEAITVVAAELNVTPARLDHALWLYESLGKGMAVKPSQVAAPSLAFPTVPRSLAQAAYREQRRAQLRADHHAPLTTFAEDLRTQVSDRGLDVPNLDPLGGGMHTRILCLLEAPGGRAAQVLGGSGFISMDNDDQTAHTVFQLTQQAELNRGWVLCWNIVPWYIGDGNQIRAVRPEEVAEGREHLRNLVTLLPDLRVVVTLGQTAAQGWIPLATEFPRVTTLLTWHPSGQSLNPHPMRRAHVLATLQLAQEVAAYAFDDRRPGWSGP